MESGFKKNSRAGERVLLFLIFTLALFLRLHFLIVSGPRTLTHDEIGYHVTTVQLLEKGVLGYNYEHPAAFTNEPNAFVTPGYPLFLALVYLVAGLVSPGASPLPVVRVVQALLSLGVVWFVFRLGHRVGGRAGGLFAAGCAAVYPPFIWANRRILTEPIFTLFLTGYVYLVQLILEQAPERSSWRWHGAAGLVLGLTVLIRPAVAPLLVVPYLIYFLNSRRFPARFFLAALCSFILVMLPWGIRNYVNFHAFIPFATQTGNPFLRGTDPYDPYDHHGPSIIENVPPEKQFQVGLQRILHGLKTEPRLWIAWFTVGKLSWLWLRPWGGLPYLGGLANVLHRLLLFGGLSGIIAAWFCPRLRWPAAVVVVMTVLQLAFIPLNRYMFPLTPLLIVLAAWFTARIVAWVAARRPLNSFWSRPRVRS